MLDRETLCWIAAIIIAVATIAIMGRFAYLARRFR